MILCFAVFANILKYAMPKTFTNKAVLCALVETIDKKHNFIAPGRDQIVSKIMNCKYCFPATEISIDESEEGRYYEGNKTSTRIIQLSRAVTLDDLSAIFESDLIIHLSEDKKAP